MSKSVLITAGATREEIDPVRFISNYSSGKQGFEITKEFLAQGWDVHLVCAFAEAEAPAGAHIYKVKTADEMLEACQKIGKCDAGIFAAAVCDYKPAAVGAQKIKKQASMNLTLEKTVDVLQAVGSSLTRPDVLVGFAAETENVVEHARIKLESKNCDLIVANNVSGGAVFGEEKNQVIFVEKTHTKEFNETSKAQVAKEIFQWINKRLN